MKKYIILIAITMIAIQITYAQKIQSAAEVKDHLFKANLLLLPSLEYEVGISEHSTLGVQLGTELGALENTLTEELEFAVFFTADIYYRYYYNFKKRIQKQKTTVHNAANYIGLTTLYANPDWIISNLQPAEAYYFQAGPVWGLQRTYWKHLSLNLELGIGYSLSDLRGQVAPIANIHLGWVIL